MNIKVNRFMSYLIGLVFFTFKCSANNLEFNEGNLQHQLFQVFSNYDSAGTNLNHIQSGKIASACFPPAVKKPITSKKVLSETLTKQITNDQALVWSTNRQTVTNITSQVVSPFFNKASSINLDELALAFSNALSGVLPGKTEEIEDVEYPLAQSCINSTDHTNLYQNAITALSANGPQSLEESNRTLVASNVVQQIFPQGNEIQTSKTELPSLSLNTDTNGTQRWLVSFSSGAQFLNPFVITVPSGASKGTLTNNGNTTVGYLQFDLSRHWVLSPYFSPDAKTPCDGFVWNEGDWTPDGQFDVGFLFANSANSSTPTYSAQTLSSSDIYLSLLLAEPIWRNSWQHTDKVAIQISVGGSIGMTTEHTFEEIHPNYFVGGLIDVGLPYGLFQDTNVISQGLVECRIGAGHLQYPSLTGTDNEVNLDGNGLPEYHGVWSPEMSANVLLPFGKALYLNVEANVFFSTQVPDQWNVKVGVTVPWATIGKEISNLGLGGN